MDGLGELYYVNEESTGCSGQQQQQQQKLQQQRLSAAVAAVVSNPGLAWLLLVCRFDPNTLWFCPCTCCHRVTYTVDWQSDRVTWAMDGVPLLTQWSAGKAKPGMLPQSSATAGSKRSLLR
jgi:hypothetical protein